MDVDDGEELGSKEGYFVGELVVLVELVEEEEVGVHVTHRF